MSKKKSPNKRFTSVGKSNITPYKQHCFKYILQENIKKYNYVIQKNQNWLKNTAYWAFDLTAGNAQDTPSSPQIFMDEMIAKQLVFELHLFERNKKEASILEKNVKNHLSNLNSEALYEDGVFCYDFNFIELEELFEKNRKWHLGLCYFDSNGCGDKVMHEYLEEFTRKWPQVDLLLNISIHQWKRTFWNPENTRNDLLSDQLKRLNKKEWWIRQMVDGNKRWNFTMIFGTNMNNYRLTHLDFHKIQLDNLEYPCEGNYLINKYDQYIQTKSKEKKR